VNQESIKGELILHAFFARSPGGSMVMFCYYLLGGDERAIHYLCHAFLDFIKPFLKPSFKPSLKPKIMSDRPTINVTY